MKPAARVGDMHVCPKEKPAPHIGGVILEPGCSTVLIGGAPAARGSSGVAPTPEAFSVSDDSAQLIRDNAEHIVQAADEFGVDPRTLAAIILRENLDNSSVKELLEKPMGFYSESWGPVGKPSIGLAQIQVATARFIEEQGYIVPTSEDESGWEVPIVGWRIHGTTTMAREKRLEDNAINSMYAAAYLKYFIDRWSPVFPSIAERPDILASLYNLGPSKAPNANPQPNPFGQDVQKLYPLMGTLLGIDFGNGDYARCLGALDQLETASTTVFFGGLPAARMGDTTYHDGVITSGCPTVLLGD